MMSTNGGSEDSEGEELVISHDEMWRELVDLRHRSLQKAADIQAGKTDELISVTRQMVRSLAGFEGLMRGFDRRLETLENQGSNTMLGEQELVRISREDREKVRAAAALAQKADKSAREAKANFQKVEKVMAPIRSGSEAEIAVQNLGITLVTDELTHRRSSRRQFIAVTTALGFALIAAIVALIKLVH